MAAGLRYQRRDEHGACPTADPGRIADGVVDPDLTVTGLGRSLMTAALATLAVAGYTQATLWVLESNARARQFYTKGGWAQDGAVMQDDSRGFPISEVRYRRPLP